MTMATESERIARIEGAYEHLATKADVESIKTEVHDVKAEVQTVKTDLQNEIHMVKSDLRAEMQALKSDLQTEIHTVRTELKSDNANMQGEIAGIKNDLRWMKWALGIVVLGVLLPFLQSLLERLP